MGEQTDAISHRNAKLVLGVVLTQCPGDLFVGMKFTGDERLVCA
jgi:hypothetical protein